MQTWPSTGEPTNPGVWLTTTGLGTGDHTGVSALLCWLAVNGVALWPGNASAATINPPAA